MASTFTTLGIELMATGENAGTWGTKTNTNLSMVQSAVAGYVEKSIAGGAQTTALTITDGDNTESTSVARQMVIKLTGTITGNQIVTVPNSLEKLYVVVNGTSGSFTVQFKTASGTGITFAATDKGTKFFFSDGTNINEIISSSVPADNISTGDAASSFATSSGAVLIDSQASTATVDGHTGVTIQTTSSGDITLDSVADIVLDADGADIFLKDAGTTYGSLTNSSGNLIIKSGTTTALTFSGANATLAGDLTISGDDLTMGTNTSGAALIGDGTNFNPVVISGDISIGTTGTAAIGSGVIVNADVNASAAIAVSKTALIAGTGISLSTNTLNVDAAQTGITSLLATDIKIGEDDQTKIDFETADEIHFYAANVEQVYVADNIFGPQSDSDVDLGSTGVRWKDAFIDTITTTGTITSGGAITSNAGVVVDNITIDGTEIDLSSGDLTIDVAGDIILDAGADVNIPSGIGLTFGNDGEKIEGDGTDLTIAGNNINLTAVADVNIPSGVGLTFATAEKIESDGTDLSITVGSNGDINIPANIGMTFGNDGEKIEGDGTDLTIAGNNINLTAVADVIIPSNVGLNFTDANEKIESDGSKLIITSGGTTFNLPTADGSNGQQLTTNGSGTLSFAAAEVGSVAADDITAGDSAVNLVTSSGAVLLDSQASTTTVDGHTGVTIQSTNSGDITLDSVADVVVDAAGGNVEFKDAGTTQLTLDMDGTDGAQVIQLRVDTDDLIFKQFDGTTVLTLDDDTTVKVATDLTVGDDLSLITDSAVLKFGADGDTTLTHTDGTGLTLNSTNKLCFNDASQFIQGASATVLDIAATDEIELTATLIDVVGTLAVSGTATLAGILSMSDGSAGAPSITNTGDTNTGLLFSAADKMQFTSGGTAQFTMENGGIIPVTDNDIDLGTVSLQFKDVYVNGTTFTDALGFGTVSMTLPTADGNANQILITDGSGALSFTDNSGGTSWQGVKTANYTASAGEGIFANTTSSAFTVTLPASPSIGDEVSIKDYAGTFDTNNLTVGRNSQPIEGVAADLTVSVERAGFTLAYSDGTQGWLLKDK